jgi:hypothetical protein
VAEIETAPESEEPTTAAAEPVALVEPAAPAEASGEVPVVVPAEVPVETAVAEPTVAEPVAATADPAAVETAPVAPAEVAAAPVTVAPTSQHVVYVEAPKPPSARGNRGIGVLLAIIATIIYAVLYALVTVIVDVANSAAVDFDFITTNFFWAPVALFLVGFVLLVLIVNRAGWAAHVLGSLFVGAFVYLTTAGAFMLLANLQTAGSAASYTAYLYSAPAIVAGLLAREVSLWMGAAIAARGRRVKARNLESRDAYDQEVAAKRAEYERANAARIGSVPAPNERVAYAPGSPDAS